MAVCADAVLIPEIPYDLQKVVTKLKVKSNAGKISGLIVVAEGAKSKDSMNAVPEISDQKMKSSLSPAPLAMEDHMSLNDQGKRHMKLLMKIQRMTDQETSALVLSQLARGGIPTVVDRQLGLGYGAGAVTCSEQ